MKQFKNGLIKINIGNKTAKYGYYYDIKNAILWYTEKDLLGIYEATPYKKTDNLSFIQIGYPIKYYGNLDRLLDTDIIDPMSYNAICAEERRKGFANFLFWYQTRNIFNRKEHFLNRLPKDSIGYSIIENAVFYEMDGKNHIAFYTKDLQRYSFNFDKGVKEYFKSRNRFKS